MDGYGLLLKILVLSLESSLFLLSLSLFFLDMATPFFLSFLLGHASLACHLFSFWGNHNLTLFYFTDVVRESYQDMEHLLMGDGWMVVLNSWCRNVAKGWDVYVLMIEKA